MDDMWKFDVAKRKWELIISPTRPAETYIPSPPPALRPSPLAYSSTWSRGIVELNTFYLFGGRNDSSSFCALWIFNVSTTRWGERRRCEEGMTKRHSAASWVFSGDLYLRGGTDAGMRERKEGSRVERKERKRKKEKRRKKEGRSGREGKRDREERKTRVITFHRYRTSLY